jgi:hypothetical protein
MVRKACKLEGSLSSTTKGVPVPFVYSRVCHENVCVTVVCSERVKDSNVDQYQDTIQDLVLLPAARVSRQASPLGIDHWKTAVT